LQASHFRLACFVFVRRGKTPEVAKECKLILIIGFRARADLRPSAGPMFSTIRFVAASALSREAAQVGGERGKSIRPPAGEVWAITERIIEMNDDEFQAATTRYAENFGTKDAAQLEEPDTAVSPSSELGRSFCGFSADSKRPNARH
jgi:hypothetical protein